ncbi:glycoside hydrolase family 5 [Pseudopedobacter saltans DSM 12145]|uniref:Glycoside hydrolase family 5 n=1 Tax=Pseudopedobacter saltans (strain ATCC 51119 / DSM 12145 / JCM 21818 / CCUG 39354 / LMG 10337 / NBRC 100064 / NCIMB 13643) TaxID=762903 RepID=F0SA54_PSESL|nr:cellulase family glycosylhydrolase [Pseudopedobacter saltans]ADY53618.1 glycoside hydrolase family 5 [Pseudopedobacter saltans DSM 12145]
MKFRKLFRLIFTLCIATTVNQANAQGFLKAKGHLIVNEKGEKVILRGMGLGGWMLQEGYMFRVSNLGQQYRIKEAISGVVGPQKADEFYEKWLKYHTTKADIDSLASWGFNSIRLPFHYNLYTLPVDREPVAGQNTWLEKGFALTDSLLSWCKANKMYLILDLHAAPGGQGNDLAISDRDPSKPSLWESEANQQKTVALWKKLADRYKDEKWIGGYDLLNETNWGFEGPKDTRGTAENKNAPLRKLLIEITEAIRSVDKNHIIIIEGNGFGNNYRGIFPLWDSNIVVSFHKYGNFNNEGAIQSFLDIQKNYNVPVWLGESGENSNTWFTEAITLVEKHDIGWAWWQHKKIGINNPLEIKLTKNYQDLVNYWAGKGEKPDEEKAWKTLNEFLENTKIQNNVFHKDVIDAMFRQVQTKETKPFKIHLLKNALTINAVDYDLGRQGSAYFDKDTASYHFTPGVNTQGNRGRMCRNDGVDIYQAKTGDYYIGHIEDGEWLQYTINVAKAGTYKLNVKASSKDNTGEISLNINGTNLSNSLSNPIKGEELKLYSLGNVKLKQGENKIRVVARKGGFDLKEIQLN